MIGLFARRGLRARYPIANPKSPRLTRGIVEGGINSHNPTAATANHTHGGSHQHESAFKVQIPSRPAATLTEHAATRLADPSAIHTPTAATANHTHGGSHQHESAFKVQIPSRPAATLTEYAVMRLADPSSSPAVMRPRGMKASAMSPKTSAVEPSPIAMSSHRFVDQ